MEKPALSKTHKRILSTLLFVLEQKIELIEHMIQHPAENASYAIEQNLAEDAKTRLLQTCKSLKTDIHEMSIKFELRKRSINQMQYINTMQSQMWENISDAFSGKLKGYGENIQSDARFVDPFIKQLSEKIDKLRL
jgi:hypothetical protein